MTVAALIMLLPGVASSKAIAAASQHKVIVAGSDHTITLDWAGRAGSHNNVTLTGGCAGLLIYGA